MQQIGRYQILGELGRGAMGVVYRALDPAIGRPVAIKTIRLKDITDESERERLRDRLAREAQSAGLLSHPGIVTIYDVGEQGELTYVAMEFVAGQTLEKLMCGETTLAPQQIIEILRQTAAAVDYAHKKGIIHRDIKPANVMINEEGVAKITDFGVAKLSHSQQLTHAGTVLGTPNYMAPEQVRGKPVDGRADQFALAVVAYELLTGERPFPGDTLTTVLYKIVSEEPAPPHHLNPSLGGNVAIVLGRALAKDPGKRFPTATDFINALEAALKTKKEWKPLPRGASESMPTAISAAPQLPARARRPGDTTETGRRKGGGLFWKIVLAALAGLAVVAGFFLYAQRWLAPLQQPGEVVQVPQASGVAARPAPMPPPVQGQPQAGASQPEQGKPEPPKGEEAKPEVTKPAESAASQETKPPEAARPAEPPKTEQVRRSAETKAPARVQERAPAAPQSYMYQFTTAPPGAKFTLDRDPAKACTSPCSMELTAGRHTLEVTLPGRQRELRILDVDSPQELFINLAAASGTVRVESTPPGAQILINNEPQKQATPASFVLPVGKYKVTVIKDGRRGDQDIEVKDGSLLSFRIDLGQ